MSRRQPLPADSHQPTPVLRVWRGSTRTADADTYVAYMTKTGFAGLRSTPGNLGVLGLRRVLGDRTEHVVMSLWASQEAIHGFAGEEIGRAVFYPDDDRFLVDKDEHVDHFEVSFKDGWEKR